MIGNRLSHYEIQDRIGSGGMGEVYLALDTRLQRKVAIKILSEDVSRHPDRLQRFFREAKTISALNHPNILTLHEIGEFQPEGSGEGRPGAGKPPIPYLVTEMVQGRTLRSMIQAGPLDPATAIDIAAQTASGLGKAHEAGIIHRDIKPENLMVTGDGFVKILDFGLAKLVEAEGALAGLQTAENLTASGTILGTPAYLSVEQLQGQPVDGRSDLFSLGIVLHEMITGRNPFLRANLAETLSAILHEKPPRLDAQLSGLPEGLSDIVNRALAKRPGDRFGDAAEMAGALRRIQSGLLLGVSPRDKVRRSRWVTLGLPAVAVVLVGGFLLRDSLLPGNPDVLKPRLPETGAAVNRAAAGIPLPQGKLGIAILPFAASGPESEGPRGTDLGQILADAFIQILSDVPDFYVISPQRLEGISRSRGKTLAEAARDPVLARFVAEESRATAVLSGRVSRLGESYILNATITRLPEDIVIKSFQVESRDVEQLLGDLTQEVEQHIEESMGASLSHQGAEAASEMMPTRSLEAYTHYLRGEDRMIEGNWEEAVPALESAVAIDSTMAVAWVSLSCAYSFKGDDVNARVAYLKADELSDRVNDRERRWVEMDGIWVNTGNGDLYMDKLTQYIRDYPDEPRVYFYAGLAMEWLHDDPDSALTWYGKARDMSPAYWPVIKAMVDCTEKLGRRAQSVSVLKDYLARPHLGDYGRQKAQERLAELAQG